MIFVLIIQVFKRLQKLLLCLSHKRSIAYVDKLGASHDAKVLQWKLRLEEVLFGSQNLIAELIDSAENAGVVSGFNPDGDNCYTSVLTTRQTSETSLEQNAGDELNSGTVFEGLQTSTTASTQNTSIATITLCTDSASPQDASASPDVSPLLSSSDSSSVESITAPDFSPLSTTSSFSSHSGSCNDYCDTEGRYKSTEAYPTFKIVGDNLDKYVKPRDMRIDAQASTLHYFHMYAVRDRLDTSQLSEELPQPDEQILLTDEDHKILSSNFSILICRVLKKHMPFFTKFGSGVERHIWHMHSEEMSQKSEIVSTYMNVCYL